MDGDAAKITLPLAEELAYRGYLLRSVASLVYGVLAIRTNGLGESVAAHATSYLLLGTASLVFNQWQWW